MNKKFLLQFPVCIFAGLTLAGCSSQTQPTLEADTAAINDIWFQYCASFNAGDIDRWVSLWTEDGIQMPPDEPAVVGKDRILARMTGISDQLIIDCNITNAEVGVQEDWAYSRGNYALTLTPRGEGQPVDLEGTYMTIMERQPDGGWKIHRDIFNSDVE